MGNRIVLLKADFSQNNIGRITVLNELTKSILKNQTLYGENSSQANYIDEFVVACLQSGFLGENGKIKVLFLPCLAKTDDELFFDAVSGMDKMPSAEKTATTKAFLRNVTADGVCRGVTYNYTENSSIGTSQIKFDVDDFIGVESPMRSMSFGTYLTRNLTSGVLMSIGGNNYDVKISKATSGNLGATASVNASSRVSTSLSESVTIAGMNSTTYLPNEDKFLINLSGKTEGVTTTAGNAHADVLGQGGNSRLFGGSSAYVTTSVSTSLVFVSDAMTASELRTFNEYCDQLMNKLNIS